VVGQGTGSGTGVSAFGQAITGTGIGLVAKGGGTSGHGVYIQLGNGVTAPLGITPGAAPTGPNGVGDIYVAAGGIPYICTVAGTPGTWTKISST
jgi:hypothetical protein